MKNYSTYRKIMASMRRCINTYNLISDGDKIAVGVSGGKDSLMLLKALCDYQKFSAEKFTLYAVTIDLFGKGSDLSKVKSFCEENNVEFHIVKSSIYEIIFEERKEKNPCSLCSKMRRGALNTKAIELGCNKIALGHHCDDLIETFFLSLFYEGRLSTFSPMSYMDRSQITLIRPFLFEEEKNISACAKNLDLPVFKNCCPANHHTQREYMKNLMKNLQKDMPDVKTLIMSAITNPQRYNLFDKYPIYDLKENTVTEIIKTTNVKNIK